MNKPKKSRKKSNIVLPNNQVAIPKKTKINKVVSGMMKKADIPVTNQKPLKWEDAKKLRDDILLGLCQYSDSIQQMITSITAMYKGPLFGLVFPKKVDDIALDFAKQLSKVGDVFDEITKRHEGKTGEVSENELEEYYEIGSAYTDAFYQFQALTFNNAGMLTEEAAVATGLIEKRKKQEETEKEEVIDGTEQRNEE